MSSESSPVAPEIVRKVAALARLRVPEADLPAWTRQLARILSYIGQLERIEEEPSRGEGLPPPTPLRADLPAEGGGAQALESNGTTMVHGYGSVPRVVAGSRS